MAVEFVVIVAQTIQGFFDTDAFYLERIFVGKEEIRDLQFNFFIEILGELAIAFTMQII